MVIASSARLHALKVGVFEPRRILQPISDRAVNSDMCDPDQANLGSHARIRNHANDSQSDR
jgi:hypothetical protein